MHKLVRTFRRSFTLIALAIFFSPSNLLAQESILATILETSQSVVQVEAHYGSGEAARSKPFLDPKTGRIVTLNQIRGATFTQTGAGIIIDARGVIATNFHTVKSAERISVSFYDDRAFDAKPIEVVPEHDLVFLQVAIDRPVRAIPFGDSNTLALRDTIYTIGTSKLLRNTITEGKISGIGQSQQAKDLGMMFVDLLRVDFDVYKGDSGSPILNSRGQFLGFVLAAPHNAHEMTYAIPSNAIAQSYLAHLKKSETPS